MNNASLNRRSALRLAAAACLPVAGRALAARELRPVTVAQGLQNPWALAFLPDGRMLVTERAGRLRIVERDGRLGEPGCRASTWADRVGCSTW
jgi:glucose/arabinose dehydrogenase